MQTINMTHRGNVCYLRLFLSLFAYGLQHKPSNTIILLRIYFCGQQFSPIEAILGDREAIAALPNYQRPTLKLLSNPCLIEAKTFALLPLQQLKDAPAANFIDTMLGIKGRLELFMYLTSCLYIQTMKEQAHRKRQMSSSNQGMLRVTIGTILEFQDMSFLFFRALRGTYTGPSYRFAK